MHVNISANFGKKILAKISMINYSFQCYPLICYVGVRTMKDEDPMKWFSSVMVCPYFIMFQTRHYIVLTSIHLT